MIYLISPSTIKETTNISDNLDDKYLVSAIKEAQEVDLQQILGQNLLDTLKGMIDDNTIDNPENTIYKQVVDKCQFYLSYSACGKLCMLTNFKINNFGVNQTSDEKLNALGMTDTKRLEEYYNKKRDYFGGMLQNFLYNNRQQLPELDECQCRRISSNLSSSAATNIWLGGYRGK